MRLRTLFAVTLTMFALPALADELPGPSAPRQMPLPALPGTAATENELCYEVRVIKVPAGYLEQAGVKLTGDTVLTESQLTRLLDVVQADRYASVMQLPKITVEDGQPARVSVRDVRYFVTGIEATKVKGTTVFVPKNTPVELGDSLSLTGSITADGKAVRVQGSFTRVRIEGSVELLPVVTQITPVFEGGSQGKPVPFTQFLQAPDVRTEKVEKTATVPADGTFVLGGWKETAEASAEPLARPKAAVRREKPAEYQVVVLATVRVPQRPDPTAGRIVPYMLRNTAAEDAARTVAAHIEEKKLKARVTFDAKSNAVFFAAEAEVERQLLDLLAKLDKVPLQVHMQVLVAKVPRGFTAECGLNADGTSGTRTWALSPREMAMFNALLRNAKERGTLDVLSRPQVCVADGQTGRVQVGQQLPIADGGKDGAEPKIRFAQTGFALELTPKLPADGSVMLRARVEITEENGVAAAAKASAAVLPVAQWVPVPQFRTHSLQTTAALLPGQTLVINASAKVGPADSFIRALKNQWCEPFETLVVLTPHIVR